MRTLKIEIITSDEALQESARYLGWIENEMTADQFIISHAKRQIVHNLTEAQRANIQKRMNESVMALQTAMSAEIEALISAVAQTAKVEVV